MTNHPPGQPVTVVVRRRVLAGREAEFEGVMRGFIAFALAAPGNLGIHVLRPGVSEGREYTVVDRFADGSSRQAFRESSAYREWMGRLRELCETEPYMEEAGGPGGWFTLPDRPRVQPPPRWKMAVVTFLGVYPLTAVLPAFFMGLFPSWHPLWINVPVNVVVVASLTWFVMPLLTRLFAHWLFPEKS